MHTGVNLQGQDVYVDSSQMAHMSLTGGTPNQAPNIYHQSQQNPNQMPGLVTAVDGQTLLHGQASFSTNQISVSGTAPAGSIPVPVQTAHPIVPSTLNMMPAQIQQQQVFESGRGGQTSINSNIIQSPISPLTNNAALFGQSISQSPLGHQSAILQAETGSPIVSPSTPPMGHDPLSRPLPQPYGIQSPIGSYPNAPITHLHNNNNHAVNYPLNQLFSQQQQQQQQQLQMLQQQQLQQQQHIYQQNNPQHIQQLANQTFNNLSFQPLPQGVAGMTSIPSTNPYIANSVAQMTMSAAPVVSADINLNVNTLPHTLPTTLNPSLKKKPIRNVINSSSGSMSPMSPRNGLFQDSWDIYEDSNTSGVGSSVSSPVSPGAGWSDYVMPRYDAPTEKDQCLKCNQKVYHMEKVGPIRDVLYHKNCFTCVACGTKLSLKNFHHNPNDSDDYNVFCTSHKPRVVNIASEGNAFYVPKTSPRMSQMTHQELDSRDAGIPNASYRTPIPETIIAEEEENVVEVEVDAPSAADQLDGKCIATITEMQDEDQQTIVTSPIEIETKLESNLNGDDIAKVGVSQNSQSNTPSGSRKSTQSNSEPSPYSSVSSTSSYATSLKNESNDDLEFKPKYNEIDFPTSYARSDRPSSMSSISTTSSTENIKMKVGQRDRISSAEQQETGSIASNSSLERPDRPSSFQRSVSTIEQPANKTLLELKKSGKMLVKSHSSQEFTQNELKGVVEPRRLLPRNESMRMDRPSQYH